MIGQALPSAAEVRNQLAGNWLLLVFALSAFTEIIHASTLILQDGRELRAGRRYRELLRKRWAKVMT